MSVILLKLYQFSSSHEWIWMHPAIASMKATIVSNSAQDDSELPSDFKEMYYKNGSSA